MSDEIEKIDDDPAVWAVATELIDLMKRLGVERGLTAAQLLEAMFSTLCAYSAVCGMSHERLRQWLIASLDASYGGWVSANKTRIRAKDNPS